MYSNMRGKTKYMINAKTAQMNNKYKNTKLKLLKTNAAIWFNRICRMKQLKPNYISFNIKGNSVQDRRTRANAIRFGINQERKCQYCKKQQINTQLYYQHQRNADYYKGIWQHIQYSLDEKIDGIMERINKNLNKN